MKTILLLLITTIVLLSCTKENVFLGNWKQENQPNYITVDNMFCKNDSTNEWNCYHYMMSDNTLYVNTNPEEKWIITFITNTKAYAYVSNVDTSYNLILIKL